MKELVIGKTVQSATYGKGIIVNENDGIITVDFENHKNICFQATASFKGEFPFLIYDDLEIKSYLDAREEIESYKQAKSIAVEQLRLLRVPEEHIKDFIEKDTIYFLNGKSTVDINLSGREKLIKGLEWYRQNHKGMVYAALAIPDQHGEKLFSYVYLYVYPDRKAHDKRFFHVKGNIGYAYAFFQNINHYNGGEDMLISFHITEEGVYGMPWPFTGTVEKLLEDK